MELRRDFSRACGITGRSASSRVTRIRPSMAHRPLGGDVFTGCAKLLVPVASCLQQIWAVAVGALQLTNFKAYLSFRAPNCPPYVGMYLYNVFQHVERSSDPRHQPSE